MASAGTIRHIFRSAATDEATAKTKKALSFGRF
jgi:hypothetical protein